MISLGRFALAALTLAFSLAGCGGAPGTAPGAPVSDIGKAKRGQSWMLPGTSAGELLYVMPGNGAFVNVYSYPDLNLVGQLTGFQESPTGLCADKQGDVFVTEEDNVGGEPPGNHIVEFAHGGINPIALLKDAYYPWSCSVDPTTGDLAVTDWVSGSVAIYPNAQGNPTYISTSLGETYWAAYDSDGNLFVSGNTGSSSYGLLELPAGSNSFTNVSLNESIELGALQWNDGYLVTSFRSSHVALDLYRIKLSGSTGTIVGTTVLDERKPLEGYSGTGQTLILGHSVLAEGSPHNCLQRWRYPLGGIARKTLVRHFVPWGIALSVAPSKK
jgi:hypothetical protein